MAQPQPDSSSVPLDFPSLSGRVPQAQEQQQQQQQPSPELKRSENSDGPTTSAQKLPSPIPSRAAHSAKLAALHARLNITPKMPLETLARALVDPSADPSPNFNNATLAYLGGTILNYHANEWLMCKYPRLPMAVLFEAMRAYTGPSALHRVARQWGIEATAFPGGEVDPGLLQWSRKGKQAKAQSIWGFKRTAELGVRRGISSRVVLDNEFGDTIDGWTDRQSQRTVKQKRQLTLAEQVEAEKLEEERLEAEAFAGAVQAMVGALFAHAGRDAARSFVRAHVISRTVDMAKLFSFDLPLRELSRLCAREGFEQPTARMLSETGRFSRTPVYVVGIFSGRDKLGEGAGPSLNHARMQASINALCAWYLYSPGDKPPVPSDVTAGRRQKWKSPHIDPGEIL